VRVLCIEEQAYAPTRWYPILYFADEQRLDPEVNDICVRSQVLAFCQSYMARFGVSENQSR
jgi:hypothetical protein